MLGVSCLNLVHLETVAQTSLMYMLLLQTMEIIRCFVLLTNYLQFLHISAEILWFKVLNTVNYCEKIAGR